MEQNEKNNDKRKNKDVLVIWNKVKENKQWLAESTKFVSLSRSMDIYWPTITCNEIY